MPVECGSGSTAIMICGRIFLASFCYDFGIHDPYKDKAMMDIRNENRENLQIGIIFDK